MDTRRSISSSYYRTFSHPTTLPHPLNASSERTRWPTGPTLPRCLVSTSLWPTSVLRVHLADLLAVCRLDTVEAFFDARISLIQGALLRHINHLEIRIAEAMSEMKAPAGQGLAGDLDWGVRRLKLKVCTPIV